MKQPRFQVRASQVVRLWSAPGGLTELERNFPQSEAVRIAAVRHDQRLSPADCEALEDSGVLVVQLPADVPVDSNEAVAKYLTNQLNDGARATRDRMAALGTRKDVPEAVEPFGQVPSANEEDELVKLLNDPANAL